MNSREYKKVNRLIIQNGIPYRVSATLFRSVIYGVGVLNGYTTWQFGSYGEFEINPRANGNTIAEIQAQLADELNAAEMKEKISLIDELTEAIEGSSLQICDMLTDTTQFSEPSRVEQLLPVIWNSMKQDLNTDLAREDRKTAERILRVIYASDINNFTFLYYLCRFYFFLHKEEIASSILEDYANRVDETELTEVQRKQLSLLRAIAAASQGNYINAISILNGCPQTQAVIARRIQYYYYDKQPEEGIRLLSGESAPSEPVAFWAAKCYILANRQSEAVELLRPFIRTDRAYRLLIKLGGVPRELLYSTQRHIVLCADPVDHNWLERFRIHLIPYERRGWFTAWDTTQTPPGSNLDVILNSNITRANLILLLISPDFLANEQIHDRIMPQIQAAHRRGTPVLWVPIRPSAYQESEVLKFELLGTVSRPLSVLRPAKAEQEMNLLLARLARHAGNTT